MGDGPTLVPGSGPSGAAAPIPATVRLGQLGLPFLILVALEFLLGMALNLYVALPTGSAVSILVSSPLLLVHVVVGLMLLGIAGRAVAVSVGGRLRTAIGVTTLGLLSGIVAFLAGMSFAFGDQSAAASYGMSVGFVGLLLETGYLLWWRGIAAVPGADARAGGEGAGSRP